MTNSLVQCVTEQVEYLKVLESGGAMSAEDFRESVAQAKTHIVTRIRSQPNCTSADGLAILRTLAESPSTSVDRAQITALINRLMQHSAGAPQGSGKQQLQTIAHPHRYPPKELWEALGKEDIPYKRRLQMFADFFAEMLGVTNPNETSYVNMLATYLMATMSSQQAFAIYIYM